MIFLFTPNMNTNPILKYVKTPLKYLKYSSTPYGVDCAQSVFPNKTLLKHFN